VTLRLLSAGAAHPIVQAVARAAGVEIEGSFGAVGAILERFDAGEACDVVILTRRQIDALAAQGRVVAGSPADLGTVATAIAVRAGQPLPDVSSGDALRNALLAADALYFPDPARATAGIHFAKVLDTLGIRAAVESRLRTFPNGATAMRELAASRGRPAGCTQATEILATPGIRLVGALPPGFDLETPYTAAVSAAARNPQAAAAFVARLTGAASRAERGAAGFH
jgi:molybdate transport system substrate-binding protein